MIKLLNIDCLKYMKTVPDKYFDLAIVDPPTGQGEGKRHNTRPSYVKQKNGTVLKIEKTHKIKDWDNAPPSQEYFDELFRVSKKHIIFCENRLYFNQKKLSAGRIVWNLLRTNDFSSCQILWTNLFQTIKYFEYLWSGMMQGTGINQRTQKGNKKLNEKRIHPSQKPTIVYRHILNTYAKPEMKILDTHGGSFNSAVACYDFGTVEYVGCEIDKDYYNDGVSAFNYHKSQMNMLNRTTEAVI